MIIGLVVPDRARQVQLKAIIQAVPGVADVVVRRTGVITYNPIQIDPALLGVDVVFYHCGMHSNTEINHFIERFHELYPRRIVVAFSGGGVTAIAAKYADDPFVCAVERKTLDTNIPPFLTAWQSAAAENRDLREGCRIIGGIRPDHEVSLQLLHGLLSIHLYRELFPSGDRLKQAAEAVKKNLEGLDREVLEIAVAAEVAERLLSAGSGNRPPSDLGARFPDADRTISKLLAEARQGWGLPVARPSSLDDVINALTEPAADEYWAEYLSELRDLLLKY